MDYGSKVFAQVYLGVTYKELALSPESFDKPIIFFLCLFLILLFYATLKTFLKHKERIIEISQILFMASITGNLIDTYLYPGNIKWIFSLNFADLYLIGAFALLISLVKLKRKSV